MATIPAILSSGRNGVFTLKLNGLDTFNFQTPVTGLELGHDYGLIDDLVPSQ